MLNYKNEKSIPFYHSLSSAAQGISGSQGVLKSGIGGFSSIPPSRNIIADGVLTKESIVGFIKSKNTSITSGMIENIVNTYTDEAKKENINLDIAIAQMCEGTDFLNNLNRLVTNNYGDLHDIKNTKLRASFPSMEAGIRAHIQQLKYYASPSGLSDQAQVVDQPRLTRIEKNRGKYPTLDQLFSVWVSVNHASYRNSINKILSDMYDFQNSRT